MNTEYLENIHMNLHKELGLTKYHTPVSMMKLLEKTETRAAWRIFFRKPCGCARFPGEHDFDNWVHAAVDYLRFRPYFQRYTISNNWTSIGGQPIDKLFPSRRTARVETNNKEE